MHFHIYSIPKNMELIDAIAFAYETGLFSFADPEGVDAIEV